MRRTPLRGWLDLPATSDLAIEFSTILAQQPNPSRETRQQPEDTLNPTVKAVLIREPSAITTMVENLEAIRLEEAPASATVGRRMVVLAERHMAAVADTVEPIIKSLLGCGRNEEKPYAAR
jgi:hypothetical protein